MQYLLSPFAHHLREYAAKLLSVNKKPAEAGFRVHLNATPEGVAGYLPLGPAASGGREPSEAQPAHCAHEGNE